VRRLAIAFVTLFSVVATTSSASANTAGSRGVTRPNQSQSKARRPIERTRARQRTQRRSLHRRGWRRPFQLDPTQRQPSGPGKTRFAVVGDSGTGNQIQHAVAAQMSRVFKKRPFESLLMLGDNTYDNGEIEKMHRTIVRPYRPLFSKGVRALPILGNHDIRTEDGKAQMHFYGLGGRRFYKTKLAAGEVELFAIDTTVLFPEKKYYPESWRAKQEQTQASWLEKELAGSKARYKIVIGHHPLGSSAEDKKGEAKVVRTALGKTLEKHAVSAYLSGHHHHYERSKPIRGVTYFISGSAGRSPHRTGHDRPKPTTAAISPKNQFMLFELAAGKLHYQTIDSAGAVIDSGAL